MGSKSTSTPVNSKSAYVPPVDSTPELDLGISGEFSKLPEQLAKNIGVIVRLALIGGGYVGVSITDDGGACRLAIRCKQFHVDRRFYNVRDLSAAVGKVHDVLREKHGDASATD